MGFGYIWLVFIVVAGILAADKNRNIAGWILLSVFTGPFAMILILLLPKIPKESPKASTPSGATTSSSSLKSEFEEIKRAMSALHNRLDNLEMKLNSVFEKDHVLGAPEVPAFQVSGEAKPEQAPAETMETGQVNKPDMEVDLGRFWLNKAGIIIFSLGVAFLITYTFRYFGPFAKIISGYLIALALFFLGIKLEKKEKFINYGRVLLGGAWAIVYFTTYAMYHFDASRIITSEAMDLFFLVMVSLGIVVFSLRYKSEQLTALALFIGYITSTMGDINYFTLLSSLLLAVIALVLVYKLQWIKIIFFGIMLSYLTHFCWVVKHIAFSRVAVSNINVKDVYFLMNAGFLCIYWLCFTLAIHCIKNAKDTLLYNRLSAANFANFILFFFMLYPKFYLFYPQHKFNFVVILGAVYLALAVLMETLKKQRLFTSNIIIAVSLLTMAIPLKFIPYKATVLWLVELPFLLYAGITFKRKVFRYLAFALALALFYKFSAADSYLAGYLQVFGMRVAWYKFLTFLNFFSVLVCFSIYRFFQDSLKLSTLERLTRNVYSALTAAYLTIFIWQVVDYTWLTFSVALEAAAVAICGYLLLDNYVRLYSLILLVIFGVRFCFIDPAYYICDWIQWFMISVELVVSYTVYFLYRSLNKKSLLNLEESSFVKPLFFAACFLVAFMIFRYIAGSWISLALGIMGVALFLVGFLTKDKLFRLGGFIIFALTLGRVVLVDLSGLPIIYKIISFITLGILFLGISFLYTKYKI